MKVSYLKSRDGEACHMYLGDDKSEDIIGTFRLNNGEYYFHQDAPMSLKLLRAAAKKCAELTWHLKRLSELK